MKRLNVYDVAMRRLDVIFNNFDYVYVSFSGGKDSGVLLNMCIEYIRKNAPHRKLGLFHMDYEAQYSQTTEYVQRVEQANSDILEVFHCCVPFRVSTCTSMHQPYWRPWQPDMQELWVRPLPEKCYTAKDFDFYDDTLWDYDFQTMFTPWLRKQKGCEKICCLVGIRTEESYNRWRVLNSDRNYKHFLGLRWTRLIDNEVCTAYPIYDWKTTDVWTANGRFGWDYNHLYDLYYQAGVPLSRQRVASPFICEAIPSLKIYRVIDPDTWGRMVSRVNGVNFACIYGDTMAMGWKHIKAPNGFSWKEYMHFLLDTLPEDIRANYLEKLHVSMQFWRKRGGCLSDETIEKLREAGVEFTVGKGTAYKTNKKPVMMEYIEDIDIAEFREIPSYKRMCICILKNDHVCKYMGFSPTKREREMKKNVMTKYKSLKNGESAEEEPSV